VNSHFFKWVVIAAYYGQGVDVCLCAGGAIIVHSGYTGVPPIVGANRGLYSIYVAGRAAVLNKTTDVVLLTHKRYWVKTSDPHGGGKRHLGLGLGLGPGLGGMNLTGGVSYLSGPAAAARLDLRSVWWREPSPELFKQAFKESAQAGAAFQWPGRLQALMAAAEEEEKAKAGGWRRRRRQQQQRRQRRMQEGTEQEDATIPVAVAVEAKGEREEGEGEEEEDAPLVPLYPGSPILVPRAEPRPSEGPGAVSRVYVASPMERCRACGVRVSEGDGKGGATATATTAEAFAGAGAEGCDFVEECDGAAGGKRGPAGAGAGAGAGEGMDEEGIMWMVPPGSGHMPNTSLAVVDLVASSSSSSPADDPAPQQVLRALNRTIASLGLGSRFHLRVVPATVPLPYDPLAEDGQTARRRLQPEGQPQQLKGADPSAPCSRHVPFRAYLVSDRPAVIASLAKGLRQPAAAATLTAALQQEEEAAAARGGGAAAATCGLRATRAMQTLIPGVNASALLQPPLAATGRGAAGGAGAMTTGIARLLAAAGKARPTRMVLFGDDDEQGRDEGEKGEEGRALGAAAASAAVGLHPTAALLLHGKGEEEEEGSRVVEVRPGETYTLALGRFPHGRRLHVRLVPAAGRGALLDVVPSSPKGEDGRQEWAWTVDRGLTTGKKYFLEVASHARDAFAYSQAFDVLS
jgi:hypothetical protein